MREWRVTYFVGVLKLFWWYDFEEDETSRDTLFVLLVWKRMIRQSLLWMVVKHYTNFLLLSTLPLILIYMGLWYMKYRESNLYLRCWYVEGTSIKRYKMTKNKIEFMFVNLQTLRLALIRRFGNSSKEAISWLGSLSWAL